MSARRKQKPVAEIRGTNVGERVEIHPRFGRWMKGDKFGEVVATRAPNLWVVLMDQSGERITLRCEDCKVLS